MRTKDLSQSDFISEDAEIEVGLRPRNLSEYIGQGKAKKQS